MKNININFLKCSNSMKNLKKFFLLILLLSSLNFGLIIKGNDSSNHNKSNTCYISSDIISIYSDEDILDYSFLGMGSPEQPYLIDGYNITSSSGTCIFIQNTTKHITIQNCFLKNNYVYSGILIDDVSSNTINIKNNIIRECKVGVSISLVNGLTIQNNTIIKNINAGIAGTLINYIIITNNTIKDNKIWGVGIHSLGYSEISYNEISNHTAYGIELVGSLGVNIHHNYFKDNYIYDSFHSQALTDTDTNYWYDINTNEGNWWSNWNCSGYYYIQTRNINSSVYDPFPLLPCTLTETNPIDNDFGSYLPVTISLILITIALIPTTYYLIRKRKNK